MPARKHSGLRLVPGSMTSIDPYRVGADSISAREPCRLHQVCGRAMLVPTNFTLFRSFFEFLPIRRQLVDVGIGQGIGFCQSRRKAAGAATHFCSRRADTRSASGRLLFKTGCGPTRRRCGHQISIWRHRCRQRIHISVHPATRQTDTHPLV